MVIRLKPKTYGPLVARLAEGRVTMQTAPAQRIAISSPPAEDAASPAEILTASIASCLAISLATAAEQMRLDVGRIEVSVSGERALDLPNRVERFSAVVSLERRPEDESAIRLLKRGKELCTVSNSLNAPVDLSIAP